MQNPMMALLGQNRLAGQIEPIKQALGMVRSAGNPAMMAQQLLANNPNYQQAQQLIQQSGGDARKAFYSLAEKVGVSPEDILSALK